MGVKGNECFNLDNEYYTPKNIVDLFGQFDYDPATTLEKAIELNIPNYDTIETDGLLNDWTIYKRIWINPPFSNKNRFIEKAWRTFQIANNEIYILFPIEYLTTSVFTKTVGGG